ncbi:MAG: type I restriction enzyme HsdR N-terminal domain-containing protein, partial [Coprobacter sp.]|nr:type I restriction enzyme HsdR N-terminal domain-containing protein [Coprobacter sp.]
EVFEQIIRYNMALKVKYLIVSNGINHYCCAVDYEQMTHRFLPEIPEYTQL